jgi:hypothetical protein
VLKDLMWLMGAAPSSPKAADRSAPLLWLTLPWDLQDVVLRAFPSTPWLFAFRLVERRKRRDLNQNQHVTQDCFAI